VNQRLWWQPESPTPRGHKMSVGKQRIVNTKFRGDSFSTSLAPTEKLLFLYLLTNPLTNLSGV